MNNFKVRFQPSVQKDFDANETFKYLTSLSKKFNTKITNKNGFGVIEKIVNQKE